MSSPVRLICILFFVGFTTGEFFDDFDPFEGAVLTAKRQSWAEFQRKHVLVEPQCTSHNYNFWRGLARKRLKKDEHGNSRPRQSFIRVSDLNDVVNGFKGAEKPCGKDGTLSKDKFDLIYMKWNPSRDTYKVYYKGLSYICAKLKYGEPVHFDSYKES